MGTRIVTEGALQNARVIDEVVTRILVDDEFEFGCFESGRVHAFPKGERYPTSACGTRTFMERTWTRLDGWTNDLSRDCRLCRVQHARRLCVGKGGRLA